MNSKKNNKNSPVSDSVNPQSQPEQKSDSRMKKKPNPAQNTKDSDPTM